MWLGETPEDVRDRWLHLRRMDDDNAIKEPNAAVAAAIARYGLLADRDRDVVDRLLLEQIQSTDEDTRFVALALVDACQITSATDALRHLKKWLGRQKFPGAPFEIAKVDRILQGLGRPD